MFRKRYWYLYLHPRILIGLFGRKKNAYAHGYAIGLGHPDAFFLPMGARKSLRSAAMAGFTDGAQVATILRADDNDDERITV